MDELSDVDHGILLLAAARYRWEANREQVALERFGLGPVAFWCRVNRLIDTPGAALAEPAIVARLRRLREQQARMRRAG